MPSVQEMIDKSKALTGEDRRIIGLYHRLDDAPNELTTEDRKYLSHALSKAFDDKQFNKRISAFAKELREGDVKFDSLEILRDISFEIPNARFFDQTIERAQRALGLASKGQKLEEREKISIAEIGMMDKVNKLADRMGALSKKGIIVEQKHEKLMAQAQKVRAIQENVDKLYDDSRYQSGDVVARETDKAASYKLQHTRREVADVSDVVQRRFTKYGHAAQLTNGGDGLKMSHMWGIHRIDEFNHREILESDVFRVDVTKLVPKNSEEGLRTKLGEN